MTATSSFMSRGRELELLSAGSATFVGVLMVHSFRKWQRRAMCAPRCSGRFAQGPEGGADLLRKQRRLLPGCVMAAVRNSVVVDQLVIGALGPASRRLVILAGE